MGSKISLLVHKWPGMAIWLVSIWLVKSNINRGRYILASYFFKVKLVKISNGSDQLLVSFSQYKHKFCIDFQIKNGFSHQTHNLCWVAWLNTQFIWLTYLGMAIWLVSIWLVKSNINRGRYILASYFFKVKLVKISNGSDQLLVSFSQYKHKFCIDFQIKNGFSHQTHNLCWVAWLNTQFIWLTYLIICMVTKECEK